MKNEKLFYYIVTNINGELICYSTEVLQVYLYLESFYSSKETGETIPTNITRVTPDENGNIPYLSDKSEYSLVELCDDVVVTEWEYELWLEYFKGYYENVKDLLCNTAAKHLKIKDNIESHSEDIVDYLRKSLGMKFFRLSSFENFFANLEKDEIKNLIKQCPFPKELYSLNKEYNRKIFDDK